MSSELLAGLLLIGLPIWVMIIVWILVKVLNITSVFD
jgi:hypothetical protein